VKAMQQAEASSSEEGGSPKVMPRVAVHKALLRQLDLPRARGDNVRQRQPRQRGQPRPARFGIVGQIDGRQLHVVQMLEAAEHCLLSLNEAPR